MKKILLFLFISFSAFSSLLAQFTTPNINGTIGANEYGVHVNGSNQQSSNLDWYMTWDNTNLYVAVGNYNNANDALVFYIDHNPLAIVNGGVNSNGSLTGTGYDGLSTNLPFRADFFAYLKPGYDDYKYHNSAGGWGASTTASLLKNYSDPNNVFEVRIPWNAITNGAGRPASFNFICFGGYNTGLYAQLPTSNPGGSISSVTLPYYFSVSTTTDGSSVKPYSRISYAASSGSANLSTASNLHDLTLNGANATLGASHNVTGTVAVQSGTLNTNGNLTLVSTASATANYVQYSGGAINGNVTVQRFVPGGRRAFRFFAHPFSSAINIAQLASTIDITGSGGSPFTSTLTNSPSAFYYDNATANSSVSPDPGWTALTASSTWLPKTGWRVLVRGSKGQAGSLTGGTYTPDAVTLSLTGSLNTGNQVLTFANSGVNGTYNLAGNPFASAIDLGSSAINASKGSNVNANFYVWNPNILTRGGFEVGQFGTSYILPSGGAFFAQSAGNTNNTITITESDKVATTPVSLFRGTTSNDQKLIFEVHNANGQYADKLAFFFNDKNYTNKVDALWDAQKMNNPDVNFISFSNDEKALAVDRRPLSNEEIIKLGFTTTTLGKYSFNVKELAIGNDVSILLKDNFLNTTTAINANSTIEFEVTSNTESQGNQRFELIINKIVPLVTVKEGFDVYPTITSGNVNVAFKFNDKAATSLRIYSTDGKLLHTIKFGDINFIQQSINIPMFAKGNVLIQLVHGKNIYTKQIIKN